MANVPTNCGTLTPQLFEIFKHEGSPEITHSHIPYFHGMMCNWAYNAAQQYSWVVVIEAINKNNLLNKIKSTIPIYEKDWDVSIMTDSTWTTSTQETVGCIFAQSVRLPGENTTVEHVGITEGSNRGFINAPIISGRNNFEPLEIAFLETNQSFSDGVLRPWKILVNHEGLLATTPDKSIKSNIYIYQLAKQGEQQKNIIRKIWTYYNAVPVMLTDEELNYEGNDYGKRQVQFVYSRYSITSGIGG